jgi:hyperosmotically inducible protein
MVLTGGRSVRAALLLSLATVSLVPAAFAQQTRPDNTAVNKRDRDASQPTADQQTNNRSDVSITRDIRRAIMNDKKLSTYAHNVKIVTQNGDVTLKGPVRSEDERKILEAKATDIVGANHVKNEVSVAPAKRRSKVKA